MNNLITNMREVLKIALPLLISTGMFSIVLFSDRTFLLWYDGVAMSASMAAGNLFWVIVCLPIGIATMTGAIIAQYVGADQSHNVGKLLWQSVWLPVIFLPWLALAGIFAPTIFSLTHQPAEMLAQESTYLRLLMIGGVGIILESGLAGFFSGTERTSVIMWASLGSAVLNIGLDYWFIFGGLGIPAMGITGAAIASNISFWFKAFVYVAVLMNPKWENVYQIRKGFSIDRHLLGKLFYFGFPAGLHAVAESGSFSWIVLNIGRLGDLPLRATTMAINFNMIAFIPLVGLQVSTSVLVGKRLMESGAARASEAVRASMVIAFLYCLGWAFIYILFPDQLMSIYQIKGNADEHAFTISQAKTLLIIVTAYLFLDAIQIILSGALRGAGDTWFVLLAVVITSVTVVGLGSLLETYLIERLKILPIYYWWGVLCGWIWCLSAALTIRYLGGRWKQMQMIDSRINDV